MKNKIVITLNLSMMVFLLRGMEIVGDKNGDQKDTLRTTVNIPTLPIDDLKSKYENMSRSDIALNKPKTPVTCKGDVDFLVQARSQLLEKKGLTVRSNNSNNSPAVTVKRVMKISGSQDNIPGFEPVKGLEEIVIGDQASVPIIEGGLTGDAKTWEMIQALNQKVYHFAKMHNFSAEEAMIYAELSNQFIAHPEIINGHVTEENGLKNNSTDYYKNMKLKDPDRYEMIVLAYMKSLFDKQDGKVLGNHIHDEHIKAQDQEITSKKSWIQRLTVGNIMMGVSTVVLGIWAIYAQIASSLPQTGNCTC